MIIIEHNKNIKECKKLWSSSDTSAGTCRNDTKGIVNIKVIFVTYQFCHKNSGIWSSSLESIP